MHYIRFLRRPIVFTHLPRTTTINVLFTITTDLGDSFLRPKEPLVISLRIEDKDDDGRPVSFNLTDGVPLDNRRWRDGMRVMKLELHVTQHAASHLRQGTAALVIAPELDKFSFLGTRDWNLEGKIFPVWFELLRVQHLQDDPEAFVSFRRMLLNGEQTQLPPGQGELELDIEEDIGESIGRHLWDAGVAAVCVLERLHRCPTPDERNDSLHAYFRYFLGERNPPTSSVNILELGCGVGIFGLGLATFLSTARECQTGPEVQVLLTDQEEVKPRVEANMARFLAKTKQQKEAAPVTIQYETLEWEAGERILPRALRQTVWDLIVLSDCTYNVDTLPALVGTLSALHDGNGRNSGAGASTYALVVTKPRHESEKIFFKLMAANDWEVVAQEMPDPFEFYLFKKSQDAT